MKIPLKPRQELHFLHFSIHFYCSHRAMKNKEEDTRFIDMAVDLAVENVHSGGGPFGAVIVKNGAIISTGVNRVTGNNDPTAHAEVMAIRKAAKKLGTHILENCTIYSSSEPCPMCLGAIYWRECDNRNMRSNNQLPNKSIGQSRIHRCPYLQGD